MTAAHGTGASPFRMFNVRVRRVRRLSPSFVRITFTGPDLDDMADNGFDQRLKLIVPLADHGLVHLPTGPDWHTEWRRLPDQLRNPIRTYTLRHVRPERREVDVDMVLHGQAEGELPGPAADFALHASPGDEAVLYGPNAHFPGRHGGLEFRPPSPRVPILLAADETGVPAVANIVSALPGDSVGQVLLEVPHPDDRFDLAPPPGVSVSWSARLGAGPGSHLLRMVLTADLPRPGACVDARSRSAAALGDGELLWDVPPEDSSPAAPRRVSTDPVVPAVYAWVAGEASTVRAIRRHLVTVLGHERRSVAFMGYWRMGRAEC